MKGAGGVVVAVVAVAAMLVCCRADPHQQDQDAAVNAVENDHKSESASLGGGLVRQARESRRCATEPGYVFSPYEVGVAAGGKRGGLWPRLSPIQYAGYYEPKRNFDEIDRSGLDNFVRKRNFDEIDLSAMAFPGRVDKRAGGGGGGAGAYGGVMFAPYGSALDKRNFDEIDLSGLAFPGRLRTSKRVMRPFSPNLIAAYDYDRKWNRPDFPMDEIDISAFPIGSKRSDN